MPSEKSIASITSATARIIRPLSTSWKGSLQFKIGFIMLIVLIGLAIIEAPLNNYRLHGEDPMTPGRYEAFLPPSLEHPLGTDIFGRDLLALFLLGYKYSLIIGLMAGLCSEVFVIVISAIAGYKGGIWDYILNSMTNAMLLIPSYVILLLLIAHMRTSSLEILSLCIAIFSWPYPTRIMRAQIKSLREMEFVNLAKVSGLNDFEIMFKEIIPNILPYIFITTIYGIIGAMMTETGLRFLGIGPGNIPSIGLFLYWVMRWSLLANYGMVIFPIVLLVSTFISLTLISAGLEEIFNPRLKRITGL